MSAADASSSSSPKPAAASPSLTDGRELMTPEMLLAFLAELSITQRSIGHPPMRSVADAKRLRGGMTGAHVKNLFLRDRKEAMWLVTCLEDRQVDLKALQGALGSGVLSFGSPERLYRYLGVEPGSVTPFALVHDRGGQVGFALDAAVLTQDLVNLHPLTNRMTTSVKPGDLLRFLAQIEHSPRLLNFEALGSSGG